MHARHVVALLASGCALAFPASALANGSSQSQGASNSNSTSQEASSGALNAQGVQANVAVPVSVVSDGSGGNVQQSNTGAEAESTNSNDTTQSNQQYQGSDDGGSSCCYSSGSSQSQEASNSNGTSQEAGSGALNAQLVQANVAVPVSVASDGSGGNVRQSNTGADAESTNSNDTTQSNHQNQESGNGGSRACGCSSGTGGDPSQRASNRNRTSQEANTGALNVQLVQANLAVPVSLLSGTGVGRRELAPPALLGNRSGGNVRQSNTGAEAKSSNRNETTQSNHQHQDTGDGGSRWCGCAYLTGSNHSQDAKNRNETRQGSRSGALNVQLVQANLAIPVSALSQPMARQSVLGPSGSGNLSQSNTGAEARSRNTNHTTQSNHQNQDSGNGGSCACGCSSATEGDPSQSASNRNRTSQEANSGALNVQLVQANLVVPVALLSGTGIGRPQLTGAAMARKRSGGNVRQSNTGAEAKSSNSNETTQSNHQHQDTGNGGCGSCEALCERF